MPALDPDLDFEDEGESLHQRRMRQIREYLRAIRRQRRKARLALVSMILFPLAVLGLLAGCAWELLPAPAVAVWLLALPVLFVAAVAGGVYLLRDALNSSAWPFAAGYYWGRRY